MDSRIDLDLLDRYLAGACSIQERGAVDRWLAEDPSRSLAPLRTGAGVYPADLGDPEATWQRLAPRVRSGAVARSFRISHAARSSHLPSSGAWGVLAGFAAAIVMLVAGWGVARVTRPHTQLPPTVYTTRNGQRADIKLPDGSTVLLNVASGLEVPADFAQGNRTVRLHGEALFSVAHRHGAPFTVIAGSATTRVLGTSFVVRHYATDPITTVAVHDGRVGVGSAVVAAQQSVDVASTGAVMPVHRASPGVFTFASGVLTLDGIRLKDAIAELDRWYDADIRLADPALGEHSVQIAAAAGSLADLANMLAFTFDARVVRNGRVLTLYPKR